MKFVISVMTVLCFSLLRILPIYWACMREIVCVRVLSEIRFILSVSFTSECERE